MLPVDAYFTPKAQAQFLSDGRKINKPTTRPSQQCTKLSKNREKQPGKGISFKKKAPYEYKLVGVKSGEHPSEKKVIVADRTDIKTQKSFKIKEKEEPKEKDLPLTVSEKHSRIRKEVEETLSKKKSGEHIEVEPLYFIIGHEEFAFMDMEPFLKAVEFALHGSMILIEGHTDNMGKDDDNLKLSMRRVARIKQLMVDIGVTEDLISIIGYGEAEPKYDNNTEEGRQKNRRVDFKVF
ncbi:MAG: OmpA family protein [Bacteroidota bacterium]|nr:OmpA family protein [Bacteroidota bacterium]